MCDTKKIWRICQQMLLLSYCEYRPSSVKSLVGVEVAPYRPEIEKWFIGSASSKLRQANVAKQLQLIQEKPLRDFLSDVSNLVEYIMRYHKTQPPPPDCTRMRMVLVCTRLTLLRDRWFHNGLKTYPRGPVLKFVRVLFLLDMWLRYWERWKEVGEEEVTSDNIQGVYLTLSDYGLTEFQDRMEPETDSTKHIPIRQWLPIKLHRVLSVLISAFQDGQLYLLGDKQKQVRLLQLREALHDRAMLLCCETQAGLAAELSVDHPDWFASTQVEEDLTPEQKQRFQADDSYRSLSKQVADHMKKETEKLLKKQFDPEELEAMRETYDSEDGILSILRAKRQDLNIKDLQVDLERLKTKQAMLEESVEGGVDDGFTEEDLQEEKEELERVKQDQEKITALMEKIKTEVATQAHVDSEDNIRKLNQIIHGEKVVYKHTSNATPEFMHDTMLKLDQTMTWHLPSSKYQVEKYTEGFMKFHGGLLQVIVAAAIKSNRTEFMEKAQGFIVSHSVTLDEREYFRSQRSAADEFTYFDVCAMTRQTRPASEKDFPERISDIILNPEHPLYDAFIDFVVHWWLGQVLIKRNIDQSIFLHEANVEFFCFDRVQLRHPVVSNIGGTWCIIGGNGLSCTGELGWYVEGGELNAIWGTGSNIIDVLYTWCGLMDKRGWGLYNYVTGGEDMIYNCELAKMYKKCI